jgi:NAD dependent epimerase/dehydratase family enzyme
LAKTDFYLRKRAMDRNHKIIVTGAAGLVGQNLITQLGFLGYNYTFQVTREDGRKQKHKKSEKISSW